jgi:hypothetical protein
MLKIPADYYRDTVSSKFKDIPRHLPVPLLGVSDTTRELVDETGMIITGGEAH